MVPKCVIRENIKLSHSGSVLTSTFSDYYFIVISCIHDGSEIIFRLKMFQYLPLKVPEIIVFHKRNSEPIRPQFNGACETGAMQFC